MLEFKEGQTYICETSFTTNWVEGNEYKVTYDEISDCYVIYDELGFVFFDWEINESRLVFKLKEEKIMLKFKEGQTYLCTKSNNSWWTVGKEYKVFFDDFLQAFVLKDNQGTLWYDYEINNTNKEFKLKEEPTTSDLIVNQPHYKNQGIEPIVLMKTNFSKEEFTGFLQGNVLKYMLRYKDKNGVEDLKKAKTYLTWLIEEEEK